MAKPRNRTADFAVYVIIRLAAAFLRALSFPTAIKLSRGLAWVMMTISKRRQQVARDNLRIAFPEMTDPVRIEQMVTDMYRHFCRVIVEIIHLDLQLRLNNWRDHCDFDDYAQYRRFTDAVLGDRGVLIVTGHFGNWELAGYMIGLFGFPGSAIARPLDNPHLDRWMRRWREATGQKMIAKNGEFELIDEALRTGRMLQTLGDQDAGQRGLFVPFFSRPASTHKAIALLALTHEPLVVVMGCARVGPGFKYHTIIEDIIDPREYKQDPDACKAITYRFTAGLERLVRRFPEQYLWIHRRWKHQPLVRKKSALPESAKPAPHQYSDAA